MRRLIVGAMLAAVTAVGVTAQAQQAPQGSPSPEQVQVQARYKVYVMEGALERAVQQGAAVLSRQVRALSPDMMFLTGAAQVRGFRLEGYGVFFDVEVPALRPTVAWTLRAMAADDNGAALAQLKAFVGKVPDARERADLQRAIRSLELQMPGRPLVDGTITAQAVTAGQQGASRPAVSTDPVLVSDPAAAYTREVKGALIEAMIENSAPLNIGNDEWLTVAARDGEPTNRLVPGDSYDLTTTILRVRGSDLAAYRAGRLTLEEASKRVESKEF